MTRTARPLALSLALTLVALAAACGDLVDDPPELSVTLEPAANTAAIGEAVDFRVKASGPRIMALIIEYGDGAADTLGTAGARRAETLFRHTYDRGGAFNVLAHVHDAEAGQASADALIQVTAP